jgi:hypothetical protein
MAAHRPARVCDQPKFWMYHAERIELMASSPPNEQA